MMVVIAYGARVIAAALVAEVGTLTILCLQLYEGICPMACENFRKLCTGEFCGRVTKITFAVQAKWVWGGLANHCGTKGALSTGLYPGSACKVQYTARQAICVVHGLCTQVTLSCRRRHHSSQR